MRVMLDTNLWSSLGDDASIGEFNELLRSRSITLSVAPSTLLEVLAIPHEEVRKRIVRGMATGPSRSRLLTEADSEAAEVVSLIRRVRPDWMHQIPNPAPIARLRTWWLKRLWREALEDSTRIHEYQSRQEPLKDLMVRRQKATRSEILRTQFVMGPLTELRATASDSSKTFTPGWDGSPATLWRLNLAQLTWFDLGVVGPRAIVTGEDRTMTDWVEPFVNLELVRADPPAFTRMWLDDARIEEVPRNWLTWAVDAVQSTKRIGSGNPADAQHASYLLDCDLFLTADARFVEVLERVRQDAPFTFAAVRVVGGDRSTPTCARIAAVMDGP